MSDAEAERAVMKEPTTPVEQRKLSMSSEEYLEAIYRIMSRSKDPEGVRSVDVADQMGVSKASVNKAVSSLKEGGYVSQSHYGRIRLTETGAIYGAHTWRCHRMLRLFLERELGVDPETADAEACLMEHALSHDTQVRWLRHLEKQGLTLEDE